ncbi:hypothetical protein HK405_003119 [Cladochytrium tenue]|nr:hypothetical protein HK405_003119 [Cladochytrium tenue]
MDIRFQPHLQAAAVVFAPPGTRGRRLHFVAHLVHLKVAGLLLALPQTGHNFSSSSPSRLASPASEDKAKIDTHFEIGFAFFGFVVLASGPTGTILRTNMADFKYISLWVYGSTTLLACGVASKDQFGAKV